MLLDKLDNKCPPFPVEVRKRLVHKPQRHIRKEHTSKRHAPLLSGRKRPQDELLEARDAKTLINGLGING